MNDEQTEIWSRWQRGAMQAPAMTDQQEIELARRSQNAAWVGPGIGAQNAAPYSKLSEQVRPEKSQTFFEKIMERFFP